MPAEQATIEMSRLSGEPRAATASSTGQRCASCGAGLAPDQRYCVECGQRRGPTRPPFLDAASRPKPSAVPPPKRGLRFSPNTALIAGIGTLMLAMATGVLIGRTSSPSSSKNVPLYVSAPTSGTVGTTSAVPSTTATASTTKSSGSGESGGGTSKGSSSNAAAKVLKGGNAPEKAVVKQGTPGKGPGYQEGHFTGKFFGGGESKKTEEEEELGE